MEQNPTPNADAAPVSEESRQATRSSFNRAVKDGLITDAVMDSFGDGYGEPYNPDRKAYGTFDGRKVWAWVSPGHPQAEVGWILNEGFPGSPKPTEPDPAPTTEPTLQERLREMVSGVFDVDTLIEAADRLDHLEAREREGRELAEALRKHDPEDEVVSYISICAGVYQRILDHLDGGSTDA